MGEKLGETPHGKVYEEVAAAMEPGTETTDHQKADGVNLATQVGSPRDDLMVKLDLVKSPPSPPVKSNTMKESKRRAEVAQSYSTLARSKTK